VPESSVDSKLFQRHVSPDVPSREISQLKNCIEALLGNKMTEATKYLPGVCRSMKSGAVRRLFVKCLLDGISTGKSSYDGVQDQKAVLNNAQFDVMVQLMNAALRNDSGAGSVSTAASLLPLTTLYCRELSPGVCQFVYTCVQDHVIWESTDFWSKAFYEAVQCELYELYANPMDDNHGSSRKASDTPEYKRSRSSSIVDTASEGICRDAQAVSSSIVLKLLAKQMQVWPTLSAEQQTEKSSYEEATIYEQCVLFASRMVWLLTPFHATEDEDLQYDDDIVTVGRRENTGSWEQDEVVRFVFRVFSPICLETNLPRERVSILRELVTGMVDLQLDTLQQIQEECSRLQPAQRTKAMKPVMLEGESVVTDGMRAYLLRDGREVGLSYCGMNGPKFLPADGAIYVTTYRVIFVGVPCDSSAGDAPITRSLPVSAIIQIKKLAPIYLSAKSHWLQDMFQIRSATFELMKVGFDDQDISSSAISLFANFLERLRNPSSVHPTFAFTGVSGTDWKRAAVAGGDHEMEVEDTSTFVRKLARRGAIHKDKEFRKESMMGTLQQACVLSPVRPPRESDSIRQKKKTIHSLRTMSYPCDFERVGLGKLTESDSDKVDELWRMTVVNIKYQLCRSYPAVVCVPAEFTDSQLLQLTGHFTQSRWPVATWRHPRTGTVLLRSASFVASNVVAKLKGGLAQLGALAEVPRKLTPLALPSIGLESQEVRSYLAAITGATPKLRRYMDKLLFEDEISKVFPGMRQVHGRQGDKDQQKRHSTFFVDISEDSEMETSQENQMMSEIKKQALEEAFTGSLDSKISKRPGVALPVLTTVTAQNQRETQSTIEESEITVAEKQSVAIDLLKSLQEKATAPQSQFKRMYIIGERQHLKSAKEDNFPFCEFIPVDIPSVGSLRQNHKKLMRACAPSDPHADSDTFFSAVQDSGWLDNVRTIIQLAGAVVDLLDVQRASVLVSFDSGWDVTCQVVSLAELLLDPYYRTRKGFQVLIEKEWLAFGHRFSQRNHQTTASTLNDFSPVFLLFLDAVHQVISQFPLAFEFNVYYIETLAYHQSSMRFSTFLLNSEKERYEEGWLPHSLQST
jgi:myotubularin-related protein 5/13